MPNNIWGNVLGGQIGNAVNDGINFQINPPLYVPQPPEYEVNQPPWDNAPQEQAQAGQGYNPVDQVQVNPAWVANYVKELDGMYRATKKKPGETTAARSVSQLSDEYLALTNQIKGLGESIHRESEELASALESLSKITEVVRDIGIVVRNRISTLQTVANQLEKWRQSLLLPDSLRSVIKQAADHSAPAQAVPPAGVAIQEVAPGLWQQGPG